MKYFSLFSGIGGFELGIEKAIQSLWTSNQVGSMGNNRDKPNINSSNGKRRRAYPICIGFSEIDKYAIQIYKKHFGGHKNYGNAKDIIWKEVPNFDLLVAGFPCQSFSIAGKRKGFKDTRGTLFFEIARAVKEKLPRLLLLENVKGLLNHTNGQTFRKILKTLDELGYDAEWQVLNSKNFGVPQNRERVFIVGHFRGKSKPKVFPIRGSDKISEGTIKKEINHRNQKTVYNPKGISPTFREGHGDGIRIIDEYNKNYRKDFSSVRTNAGCHTACNLLEDKKQEIAPCLDANDTRKKGSGQSKRFFKKTGMIRKLTPTECERLQGFPDDWTKFGIDKKGDKVEISDTQRYKCLGNAVTVNVIEVIISKLFTIK